MKAILVGNYSQEIDNVSYSQLFPFFQNREKLRKRFDLEFHHLQADKIPEIAEALQNSPEVDASDILFIRPSWRHETEEAVVFFSDIRKSYPDKKIILIDPWDQVTGRYLAVAGLVDYMFKYQGLKDPQDYLKTYAGGTVVTDYLHREFGYDVSDWDVGSQPPADCLDRILPGWNFAAAPRFQNVLMQGPVAKLFRTRRRSIDVFCRLGYGGADEWYGKYRKMAVEKIHGLGSEYTLAVSGDKRDQKVISTRQYFEEIKRARIAVSPFGWGEVTYRDYEAIAYGCLLVKPNIDQVKVAIFAGGKGSRLIEETTVRPKPLVEIGRRPLLWHIMQHYSVYGHHHFVLALGYMGERDQEIHRRAEPVRGQPARRFHHPRDLRPGEFRRRFRRAEPALDGRSDRHRRRDDDRRAPADAGALPQRRHLHADLWRRAVECGSSTSWWPSTRPMAARRR
jgi:hypothetical protein